MDLISFFIGTIVIWSYMKKIESLPLLQGKDEHDFVRKVIKSNLLTKIADMNKRVKEVRCHLSDSIIPDDDTCSYDNFCNQRCIHWSYYQGDVERTIFSGCLFEGISPILEKTMLSISQSKKKELIRKTNALSSSFHGLMAVFSDTFVSLQRDYGIQKSCPVETKTAFRDFPSNETCLEIDEDVPAIYEEKLFQVFKELSAVTLYMHHYLNPFMTSQNTEMQLLENENLLCNKQISDVNNDDEDEFYGSGNSYFR